MAKRRNRGDGSLHLRKDGRWEGRCVVGYDDKGLPVTKNVLAKTKSECAAKLAQLRDTLKEPAPDQPKPGILLADWLDLWYENYSKPVVRPSTQRIYEGHIRLYSRHRLGHSPLNKLTTNDIQQFCTWMKTDGDSGSGLADSQVINCHSLCCRALGKVVMERLIARNPAEGCKLPTLKRKEMKILSREAMQRPLIQANEENYYERFLLEFATGLRLGELMALQWDDLDLTTGELQINKQVNILGSELVVNEPKTKAAVRTLLLPPSVLNVMRAYRNRIDSRWLFPSPKKEDMPLRPSVVHRRLHRLLDHAECERVRYHDLWHTFATPLWPTAWTSKLCPPFWDMYPALPR